MTTLIPKYDQGAAGAVNRPFNQKLAETITVEDFGAVGDGTTDDSAAFTAMLVATSGFLGLSNNKQYKVNQLNITGYTKVSIIGQGKPLPNSGLTQLVGGSIIVGGLNITANTVYLENFGLDFGSGRTVTATDGIVVNALSGQVGIYAYAKSVSCLGASASGTTHGLLVQGYSNNTIDDIYVACHAYGVVLKGQNGTITNIQARSCNQAAVFPKGDTGAPAANVANGQAKSIAISDVIFIAETSNTTASGVWVQASTDIAAQILVNNVYQKFGYTALYVSSAGSLAGPFCNLVSATNIMSESAQLGAYLNGYINNCQISNLTAINPVTGYAVNMGGNVTGWTITNVNVLVTDAAVTSAICMQTYGIGLFDNISVINSFRDMEIVVAGGSLANIKTGNISGDCFITNEGSLTGINGATLDATQPATLEILPRSAVKLSGRFDVTASTNKAICNLPINTGKQAVFTCAGIDSTDAYVAIVVRLNDFQLTVEPSIPAGFKKVDLSGITIAL